MLAALLLLQAVPPPCIPAALCGTLEAAARVNARAAARPNGYTAVLESESAMLDLREGRIEGATSLEQSSSRIRWSPSSGYDQHVVGYRSFPNSLPLSSLFLRRLGSMAPMVAGDRIAIHAGAGLGRVGTVPSRRDAIPPELLVHPLATDRSRYYRLSGGDVQQRTIDGVTRRVMVVTVRPAVPRSRELGLFEGELDLDPGSLGVVRLIGQMLLATRSGGNLFHLPDPRPPVTLIELINQPTDGRGWIPLVQRFEIQARSSSIRGRGAARRVISRFFEVGPPSAPAPTPAPGENAATVRLSRAPRDSIRRFRDWHTPAGQVTNRASLADFAGFREDRDSSAGPVLRVQTLHQSQFFRLNRIEGVFTGAGAVLELGDRAPGIYIRGNAGYAWTEQVVRGGGGIGWARQGWAIEAEGARSLEPTNEFRNQFDSPSMALIGRDPWDYVDRRWGAVSVGRRLQARGGEIRLEGGRVRDAGAARAVEHSLFGKDLRENRRVTPGSFWRARASADWNPDVSPLFTRRGLGARVEWEGATGDLEYSRIEGRAVFRTTGRRIFLVAKLHGGMLWATTPPPQQLFELGGEVGLPGYEYKEFAGTRAALFRIRASYPLPVLEMPIRLGRGIGLPALSPALSLGFQAGATWAPGPAAAAAVAALAAGSEPAAQTSGGLRSSVDLRVGIFGDALAVGLARALSAHRNTTLILAVGRQF